MGHVPSLILEYVRHVRSPVVPGPTVNGGWDELRDRFCLAFFPISRIASLRKEILDFHQDEKETIGAAWARFS
jgi:hypothetical protein